ncbi:MAG: hypothetical protein ACFFD1_12540, partial [Candidatus Thorarchaeota archaeon]
MEKETDFVKFTNKLFDDLLNLQYVVIFNEYGVSLCSIDIGRMEISDLLISGLLRAIISVL